jgi:ankyrin repeat protein
MPQRRVEFLFQNFPDKYPRNLQLGYPRILMELMQLWGTPDFDRRMQELMVNTRHDREGFSKEALEELLFLNKLHDATLEKGLTLPPLDDPWKKLPLHLQTPQAFQAALQRGDVEQVKLFLDAGVSINHHFENDLGSPLSIAVSHNKCALALFLTVAGANVNMRLNQGYTALHWAAFFGFTEMANVLLKQGALIDVQEANGNTPLMLAITRRYTAMVYLLLMHGADRKLGNNKGSPLDHARRLGAKEIVAMLQDKKG